MSEKFDSARQPREAGLHAERAALARRARARLGLARVGRRRPRVHRPDRRLGRDFDRSLPSRAGRGDRATRRARLMQTTNNVYTRPQLDLAERLARVAPGGLHQLVLHVERRRGERGRAEARRAQDRPQPLPVHVRTASTAARSGRWAVSARRSTAARGRASCARPRSCRTATPTRCARRSRASTRR